MATILNVDRDGKPLPMGDMFTNTIVSRQIGAQHLAVNYTRYEPGAEFPQHVHEDSEDVLFVVTGAGWLKEAGLKYRLSRSWIRPAPRKSLPFQLGRCGPPKLNRLFDEVVRLSGTPLRKVAIPLTCHPLATTRTARLPFSKGFLAPNGSS